MNVEAEIRKIRIRAGLSITDVAELAGIRSGSGKKICPHRWGMERAHIVLAVIGAGDEESREVCNALGLPWADVPPAPMGQGVRSRFPELWAEVSGGRPRGLREYKGQHIRPLWAVARERERGVDETEFVSSCWRDLIDEGRA